MLKDTQNKTFSTPEKVKTCHTCGYEGHRSRDCDIEKKKSEQIKRKVGHYMETFISKNIKF